LQAEPESSAIIQTENDKEQITESEEKGARLVDDEELAKEAQATVGGLEKVSGVNGYCGIFRTDYVRTLRKLTALFLRL